MADESGTEAESTTEPVEPAAATTESTDADSVTEKLEVEADETREPASDEDSAAPTEVMEARAEDRQSPVKRSTERRFTAPSGFDAGATQKIDSPPEPETEVFPMPGSPSAPTEPVAAQPNQHQPLFAPRTAAPQAIPARVSGRRSWLWVLALVLVIAALAAVAILGTVWLTRGGTPKVSQEDLVKQTIQNFDVAIQKGDLATLRGITCGTTRDNYVNYDDRAWNDTHARIAAAKQYPVVASIDQVVVNGQHAEANVTTFMAYDPATRSTRSFDLQFRDDQWKICQAPGG
jgi:hypothetical protein